MEVRIKRKKERKTMVVGKNFRLPIQWKGKKGQDMADINSPLSAKILIHVRLEYVAKSLLCC